MTMYTYGCGHTVEGKYPPSERVTMCYACYRRWTAGLTTDQIREIRQERANRKAARLREWAEGHEKKSERYAQDADRISSIIPLGQPILVGHHSEGRHRRDMDRVHGYQEKRFEHHDIAQTYIERAERLEACVRVRGDAERKRQAKREENDKVITVGSVVKDFCFGTATVTKVNKKTYTLQFETGSIFTRDKTSVEVK